MLISVNEIMILPSCIITSTIMEGIRLAGAGRRCLFKGKVHTYYPMLVPAIQSDFQYTCNMRLP